MNKLKYLEEELAKKTDKPSIYNAYQRNNLTVVNVGSVWWLECCYPDGLCKTVKSEMCRLYPSLTYLYDLKQ